MATNAFIFKIEHGDIGDRHQRPWRLDSPLAIDPLSTMTIHLQYFWSPLSTMAKFAKPPDKLAK